jgi:hypothetical protein
MKGDYSDKHIIAVTCDKQKSEKIKECYSNDWNDARIEEWDEPTISFISYYRITHDMTTGEYETEKKSPDELCGEEVNYIYEYYHNDGFNVTVQAENETVALKIARDLWAEYKAKKEEIV